MKNKTLVRLLEESGKALADMSSKHWPVECRHLIPSYNAILRSAKANHPNDDFLSALEELEMKDEEVSAQEMHLLFVQLRIALEAIEEENSAPNTSLDMRTAALDVRQSE